MRHITSFTHFQIQKRIETGLTIGLKSIGGDILGLDNAHIHKYRRVCHAHFETKYLCRFNRISKDAVPTINIPAPTALPILTYMEQRPLKNILDIPSTSKEKSVTHHTSSDGSVSKKESENTKQRPPNQIENIPSTSKENIFTPAPHESESKIKHDSASLINLMTMECKPQTQIENIPLTFTVHKKEVKVTSQKTVSTKFKKLTTSAELSLYKKLVRIKVKLSKFRNKVKKQRATIKSAKNILTHPKLVEIMENVPAASKVLTLMQFREHKKKDKGRRFTMEEKILALSILKQSPKGYRFLRKLLILPAPPTLAKLLNKADIRPGINPKIFKQLKQRAEKLKLEERLSILMFDEMSLKAHLSFNERKDEVVGFATDGHDKMKNFADHAQVFMVRGLIKNYKQPVSYTFSTAATKGPERAKQIKNDIGELQKTGLIIVAIVCDQGSNNRQAIKLLLQETRATFLRRNEEPKSNVIVINEQEIVPLYDPPHLLKCIRNNLLTKNLNHKLNNVKGTAKWSHLELLLKENSGYKGIRLIPKLTDKHVLANQIPKMKVKYAWQVFSQTVGNNMGYL